MIESRERQRVPRERCEIAFSNRVVQMVHYFLWIVRNSDQSHAIKRDHTYKRREEKNRRHFWGHWAARGNTTSSSFSTKFLYIPS